MRNSKALIIFSIIALILFSVLFYTFITNNKQQSVNIREYSGTLEVTEVDVRSEIPGQLLKVNVAEGDTVKQSQLLAKIDASTILAQKSQAQAKLIQARAALEKAVAGARPEQISAAQAQADKANSAYQLAKDTYTKIEQLHGAGGASKQKLQEAQTSMETAQEDYNAAKQQLDLYLSGTRQEDIDASKGVVQEAEAAVQESGVYLGKSTVKAPIDGEITMRAVDIGDLVSSGHCLFTIADMSDKWLSVYVSENQLGGIKPGVKCGVSFMAFPGEEFEGEVVQIGKEPSFATIRSTDEQGGKDIVSFEVKVQVNSADERLLPGMTGYVTFKAGDNT